MVVVTSYYYMSLTPDLVDGEADGVHVLAVAAEAAAVFLHQSHQEAAGRLVVFGVIVLLQQRDLILRVDPEGVCREAATARASWEMQFL